MIFSLFGLAVEMNCLFFVLGPWGGACGRGNPGAKWFDAMMKGWTGGQGFNCDINASTNDADHQAAHKAATDAAAAAHKAAAAAAQEAASAAHQAAAAAATGQVCEQF